MAIRVLVVDDSSFIRHRVTEILDQETGIEVIGVAMDGVEAVRKAVALRPDVITMDVEMPVLDGISAVRRIMRECPTPILMFSHATQAGARATLDALEAGAMDFLPKDLGDFRGDSGAGRATLVGRIRDLGRTRPGRALYGERHSHPLGGYLERRACLPPPDLRMILIAASTGGPVALQRVLSRVPAGLRLPVLIVQHMPANFTAAFAERLDQTSQISVREARDGDSLSPGVALVAPGGKQMELGIRDYRLSIRIREGRESELFRPSADVTFTSVADAMRGRVLVLVLTGMGSDGRLGAQELKRKGAVIWTQDEASCAVYGMPRAVVDAGLADGIYNLDQLAGGLERL